MVLGSTPRTGGRIQYAVRLHSSVGKQLTLNQLVLPWNRGHALSVFANQPGPRPDYACGALASPVAAVALTDEPDQIALRRQLRSITFLQVSALHSALLGARMMRRQTVETNEN